jgi:hypothetical protein
VGTVKKKKKEKKNCVISLKFELRGWKSSGRLWPRIAGAILVELQNLSSPTFFDQPTSYMAVIFLGQFRREWLGLIFELGL